MLFNYIHLPWYNFIVEDIKSTKLMNLFEIFLQNIMIKLFFFVTPMLFLYWRCQIVYILSGSSYFWDGVIYFFEFGLEEGWYVVIKFFLHDWKYVLNLLQPLIFRKICES